MNINSQFDDSGTLKAEQNAQHQKGCQAFLCIFEKCVLLMSFFDVSV